ncbi:hypothetical protein [Thalassoroseus pseudoceratinae]|uniref:hypothetical protein n=1 Tax=Thalassoroseus pseudoceratinae TaxID=2713176 RepID=UPI00141DDB41|nr:hypothetical protein [Thalassoroseus pseudoceratinae]
MSHRECWSIDESLPSEPMTLPLVPFERFMMIDDRPEHPMTFYTETRLAGEIDPEAMQQAAIATARRSPLLCSRVDNIDGVPHWVAWDEFQVHVDEVSEEAIHTPPRGTTIDLHREIGWRIWFSRQDGNSILRMQFHHAACDGKGAAQVFIDLMTGYSQLTAAKEDQIGWRKLRPESLPNRGVFPPVKSTRTVTRWQAMKGAWDFHMRKPKPLASERRQPISSGHREPLQWEQCEFTAAETENFRRLARELDCTLNDAATALLFRTLSDWNTTHTANRPKHRLRILIPTDLRNRADGRLPAANRMGFAFITRPVSRCADWDSLLEGVRAETEFIKDTQAGRVFLNDMSFLTAHPKLLAGLLRRSKCLATAVLTNLDDPLRRFRRRFPSEDGRIAVGNLRITAIYGLPPIRMGTRAGFGICHCNGEMTLSLQTDPAWFTRTDTRALLESYAQTWRDWAAAISGSAVDTINLPETTTPKVRRIAS